MCPLSSDEFGISLVDCQCLNKYIQLENIYLNHNSIRVSQ